MSRPTKRSFADKELLERKSRAEPSTFDVITAKSITLPSSVNTPEKEALWSFITSDLASRKILSETYLFSIEMLIDCVDRLRTYRIMLDETGPLIPVMSKDGEKVVDYKQNPMFAMVMQLETRVTKLCEKFGLTPRDVIYLKNPDVMTKVIETKAESPTEKKEEYFR